MRTPRYRSRRLTRFIALLSVVTGLGSASLAQQPSATLTIDLAQPGRNISPDLFGVFFEDINYAADGGLHAELVQNRSFEYHATEQLSWSPTTSWEFAARGGGRGSLSIETAVPVHSNNPRYAVVDTAQPGAGVGLINSGLDGIPLRAGAPYEFSMQTRQLFVGNRWGNSGRLDQPSQLVVRLEDTNDTGRANTLWSALAEAAYLTALERNGDVVRLASYAPLLAKQGRTQWRPDMIYFNNTQILLSANYHVQQMFGQNAGDVYLAGTLATPSGADTNPAANSFSFSCVRETRSGDVILKLVNVSSNDLPLQVRLPGNAGIKPEAIRTVLAGERGAVNRFDRPPAIAPETGVIPVSKSFLYSTPPWSLTVLRIRTR